MMKIISFLYMYISTLEIYIILELYIFDWLFYFYNLH